MAPIGRPAIGKLRHVRVSDADWEALKAAAAIAGTDASTVMRQLIAAYLGRPGAQLPRLTAEQRGQVRELASTDGARPA